jgi:DNA-binding CsgD family transcriptional regulator
MIPAGFRPGETEFFVQDEEFKTMHEGVQTPYPSLPSTIHTIVGNSIDAIAHQALDELSIEGTFERHVKFLECNCASYDFTADIAPGYTVVQREYVRCGKRHGECAVEGRLCKYIIINGHKITPTELRIASFIREGLQDKEICSILNIAPDTLRSHKRNIQPKLGAITKVHIATQSIKYGIA